MNTQTGSDIGRLINGSSDNKAGGARIAGTGITVRRIAGWHRMGKTAEEIASNYGCLDLAQVHAALACYFANREEIDSELDAETTEYDRLAAEHRGSAGAA